MTVTITNTLEKINNLDHYTKAAIVGSISFLTTMQCINAAMRIAPPVPEEGSGIDGLNTYETMRAELAKDELTTTNMKMWVNAMREISDYAHDNEITTSNPDDVINFLAARPPSRKQFVAEYENRRRAGCTPKVSVKEFVDGQYAEALEKHEHMIANASNVVRLINTTQGQEIALPDWYFERIEEKIVEKCNTRWVKIALRESNPRLKKAQRDEASNDLTLIRAFVEELGYEIYEDGSSESEESINDFLKEAGKLDDVGKNKKTLKKAA